MSLMFIMYLIAVLPSLKTTFIGFFVGLLIASILALIFGLMWVSESGGINSPEAKIFSKYYKILLIVFVTVGVIEPFIPNENGLYLVAGAYIVQKVISNEKVGDMGDKMIDILTNKLTIMAEESKDEATKLIHDNMEKLNKAKEEKIKELAQ